MLFVAADSTVIERVWNQFDQRNQWLIVPLVPNSVFGAYPLCPPQKLEGIQGR